MTEATEYGKVERATGRRWDEWVAILEQEGAQNAEHSDIAKMALTAMPDVKNPEWWAQSVAISYEQFTGKRVIGQSCDGSFAASASKTLSGTMDEVLQRFVEFMDQPDALDGVPLSEPAGTSQTDKWRYWRCSLEDGSRVSVNIYQKTSDKCSLGVQHSLLNSMDDRERWKSFWKTHLKNLA